MILQLVTHCSLEVSNEDILSVVLSFESEESSIMHFIKCNVTVEQLFFQGYICFQLSREAVGKPICFGLSSFPNCFMLTASHLLVLCHSEICFCS